MFPLPQWRFSKQINLILGGYWNTLLREIWATRPRSSYRESNPGTLEYFVNDRRSLNIWIKLYTHTVSDCYTTLFWKEDRQSDRTEGGQTAARLWERLFTAGSVSSVAEYPRLRLIRQNSESLIPDRSEHGLNYKPFKYAYTYTGPGLFITQSGRNRACILWFLYK